MRLPYVHCIAMAAVPWGLPPSHGYGYISASTAWETLVWSMLAYGHTIALQVHRQVDGTVCEDVKSRV